VEGAGVSYRTCRCTYRGCQCVTPTHSSVCDGCRLDLHVSMVPISSALSGDEHPVRWSLLRARAEDGRFTTSGQP